MPINPLNDSMLTAGKTLARYVKARRLMFSTAVGLMQFYYDLSLDEAMAFISLGE